MEAVPILYNPQAYPPQPPAPTHHQQSHQSELPEYHNNNAPPPALVDGGPVGIRDGPDSHLCTDRPNATASLSHPLAYGMSNTVAVAAPVTARVSNNGMAPPAASSPSSATYGMCLCF